MLTGLSAITLATHDMARSVAFYEALGFVLTFGGPNARFTSLRGGASYVNLTAVPAGITLSWWGRVIFHVDDVDQLHRQAVAAGFVPAFAPREAAAAGAMNRGHPKFWRLTGRTPRRPVP